jgi:hypothetical protein
MADSKKGEFVDFIEIGDTGKTKRYSINTKTGDLFGGIQWYGAWRKYCFFPSANTIWDSKCLNEVNDFISRLMEQRKQLKK